MQVSQTAITLVPWLWYDIMIYDTASISSTAFKVQTLSFLPQRKNRYERDTIADKIESDGRAVLAIGILT